MVDTNPVPLTSTPAHAPRLMRWASIASMSVATVLIAAKTGAWLITDSVSMLSSLVDSSLDLVSSLITFLAIRTALTPADEDHRFGHGKAEALAGVAQAGFIAASAGGLLLTVIDRFRTPKPVQDELVGMVVSALAVVLTFGLMTFQGYVVRRTSSLAVTADRAHYTTDMVANIAVGVGIWLSSRFAEPMIDLAVALGVAVYLCFGAWGIGRQSIDVLMDRELPDEDRRKILHIVRRHPGVQSVHDLRTRSSGLHQFIQLHMVLHPTMSLGRAHVISDSVESAIREAFPRADVTVHIDPYDDEPEFDMKPSFVVEDQSAVIAALEKQLAPAKRIDTHGAVVFLSGDRAYKLKRAVKFPYMDFSTAERRRAMCEAEVEINRRLAPEIYLGVEQVENDWVVVMCRFDEDGLLDRMAERGQLTPELMASLGARIARYHDSLAPIRDGFGRPDDYRHSVAADIRQMLEQGDRLDPDASQALADLMPKALEPYIDLVARRVEAGAIRRCHGDMHLRNIVLIDGNPVPFDAIEFSERIANIDVLYDLSFALMDLCERKLQPLANRLLNEWIWRIAELPSAPHHEALALLPMFLSRRASIRAFVDSQAAAVGNGDTSRARDYQRVALSFLEPAPPRLMAIGGLSGSGKSTMAIKRAPEIGRVPGAVVVRSDVERKRLAGLPLEEHMPRGSYTPEGSAKVYAAMFERAGQALRAGHSAILDAVFAKPEERQMAEALAREVGVPFEGLWLEVPKEIAQARVAGRGVDASDATPAVVARQFGYDLGEIRWRRLDALGKTE